MSAIVLTDARRAGMNALYAAVRAAAPDVPRWVAKAYVEAAHGLGDRAEACALAHFGVTTVELGPAGAACARAWAARLRAVEMAAAQGSQAA